MYGYGEYIPLTPEEILKRVSQKDIFEFILKEEVITDKGAYYLAPYRSEDTSPGCWLEVLEGNIYLVDFADSVRNKNWINLLKKTFNISYKESLELVNSHFKLGLGDNVNEIKEVLIENDYVVEEKKITRTSKERVITIIPRPFNYKDKQFWGKYNISRENLIEDKVVPIEMYRAVGRKGNYFTVKPFDICYAYTDFPQEKKKIYRPHSPMKEGKWYTDCNQNDVGCIRSLPKKGDLLLITKAYKDCRVVRNKGVTSVWFQNEGMFPSIKIIKNLCKRFKKIIIWFDNDSAGLTNAKLLMDYINSIVPNKATTIVLPPILLVEKVKDPSDLFEKKGEEVLVNFLKEKKLIS